MSMFERLQRPFLTVKTGEAYQPIRLTYELKQPEQLIAVLSKLNCITAKHDHAWDWFWRDECDDLHFESLDSYKKNEALPERLGTFTIKNNTLYLSLPSFKRACLAVPFFHRLISADIAKVHKADFLNKVFGLNERLPHGFSELFNENELERIVEQRIHDYEAMQARCEQAASVDEAAAILAEYTKSESKKRLPYAERYTFHEDEKKPIDPDIVFLGFYIFLRGREMVAIHRWFGETGYSLANAAEETVEQVFGGMNIDIIE